MSKIEKKVLCKHYKKGDIVYWVKNCGCARYEVHWGRVDEQYCDKTYVDYLEAVETRYITPTWNTKLKVPIDKWKDERFHKLPKGWTYNTVLYTVGLFPYAEEHNGIISQLDIRKPESIKKAYKAGFLVKSKTKFHGEINANVTKEGYRIELGYPRYSTISKPTYAVVENHRLHSSYHEAEQEMAGEIAEFKRQSALSDEEWSREQIHKDIVKFANFKGKSLEDEEIREVIKFFENMPKLEDVVTRVTYEGLQYKENEKRKRWATVEV